MFQALCAPLQEVNIITLCKVAVRPPTECDVLYNTIFDLLMMSTWCFKHVEAYNKLIIKQEFVHYVGQLRRFIRNVKYLHTNRTFNSPYFKCFNNLIENFVF